MHKRYRLKYQTTYVTVDDPRTGICEACGQSVESGDIKNTQCHHYRYAYRPKTVRKEPEKALENILELDFYCHSLADALRTLYKADNERILQVFQAHPKWFRKELLNLAKRIVHQESLNMENEEK